MCPIYVQINRYEKGLISFIYPLLLIEPPELNKSIRTYVQFLNSTDYLHPSGMFPTITGEVSEVK